MGFWRYGFYRSKIKAHEAILMIFIGGRFGEIGSATHYGFLTSNVGLILALASWPWHDPAFGILDGSF